MKGETEDLIDIVDGLVPQHPQLARASGALKNFREALASLASRQAEDERTISRLETQYAVLSAHVDRLEHERNTLQRLYCHAQASTVRDTTPHQLAKNLGWRCFEEGMVTDHEQR